MEVYNFNLAIIGLLILLLTIKYLPNVFPKVVVVKTISNSFMQYISYIILLLVIIFFVLVWMKANSIVLDDDNPKVKSKDNNENKKEIGTISI